MKKPFFRLLIGILVIIALTILNILLFDKVLKVMNLKVLKWFPLFMCFIGFYMAGIINRKTEIFLTPLLLISLVIYIPLELFYFPYFLTVILFSSLGILLSRREIVYRIKIPLLVILIGIFGFFLFSQPLIIENKGFGIDPRNDLYNATVLWDFKAKKPASLPNEIFQDTEGKTFSLKELEGKTLYITFWATWCGPCIAEKPELEKLKMKFQDHQDIVFVDISVDSNIEKWKSYLSGHNSNGYQIVSQNVARTYSNFNFSGIPFHIIVDSDGKYKKCHGPYILDEQLLSNPVKLNEYLKTPYKVFKTIKLSEKDTIVRVR
ncbi:TlpA family protein disulfide reductase [Belliella kenyensis]|uniref:TlpA family protein disulfide reductase n=1 Tax=Belliella kenyensis TaxID=1472724 RepID=A0ABV8EPV7_9BACT|nr:TlpA disulfide reductase family protein [Belliella kenyensis]MCH7402262.1 TlpA family protein disulfide reductase [Belliella kenyensis]MDN3601778.1 TlpA disulfide reductase family protein [Belliella kenyensis]